MQAREAMRAIPRRLAEEVAEHLREALMHAPVRRRQEPVQDPPSFLLVLSLLSLGGSGCDLTLQAAQAVRQGLQETPPEAL